MTLTMWLFWTALFADHNSYSEHQLCSKVMPSVVTLFIIMETKKQDGEDPTHVEMNKLEVLIVH